jgi:hypothetical protein
LHVGAAAAAAAALPLSEAEHRGLSACQFLQHLFSLPELQSSLHSNRHSNDSISSVNGVGRAHITGFVIGGDGDDGNDDDTEAAAIAAAVAAAGRGSSGCWSLLREHALRLQEYMHMREAEVVEPSDGGLALLADLPGLIQQIKTLTDELEPRLEKNSTPSPKAKAKGKGKGKGKATGRGSESKGKGKHFRYPTVRVRVRVQRLFKASHSHGHGHSHGHSHSHRLEHTQPKVKAVRPPPQPPSGPRQHQQRRRHREQCDMPSE